MFKKSHQALLALPLGLLIFSLNACSSAPQIKTISEHQIAPITIGSTPSSSILTDRQATPENSLTDQTVVKSPAKTPINPPAKGDYAPLPVINNSTQNLNKVARKGVMQLAGIPLTAGTFSLSGLNFTLLKGWQLINAISITNGEQAQIKLPDPQYQIVTLFVAEKINTEASFCAKNSTAVSAGLDCAKPLKQLTNAKIFAGDCGKTATCYYLIKNSDVYRLLFSDIDSNEPKPANAASNWKPRSPVTAEEILEFVSSVK